jgi:hypothetical protein
MSTFLGHVSAYVLLRVYRLASLFLPLLLSVAGFAMDFYANATKTHDFFFFSISLILLISFSWWVFLHFSCLIAVAACLTGVCQALTLVVYGFLGVCTVMMNV